MRFGVCTWVWVSPLCDADVLPIAERVRGLGFDVLEVCIEDPELVFAEALIGPVDATGSALATAGLAFLRQSAA